MALVRHRRWWLLLWLMVLLVGAPAITAANIASHDEARGQTCLLPDHHDTIPADMIKDGGMLIIQEIVLSITRFDYDDRLVIGTQTLTYTSGFSQESLALQSDGTYQATRTPLLVGIVGRVNQDGTATLRDKQGTVRMFGSDGWLRTITDRNGNTVTVVRSGAQIQQIIEPGGRALTFQYGSGGISQITDPLGRTVTYTYVAAPPTTPPPAAGGSSCKRSTIPPAAPRAIPMMGASTC